MLKTNKNIFLLGLLQRYQNDPGSFNFLNASEKEYYNQTIRTLGKNETIDLFKKNLRDFIEYDPKYLALSLLADSLFGKIDAILETDMQVAASLLNLQADTKAVPIAPLQTRITDLSQSSESKLPDSCKSIGWPLPESEDTEQG